MRHLYFITVILLFTSCKDHSQSNLPSAFVDTTQPFLKEIPTYHDGGVSIFYELAKTRGRQLGLDSIENGFDNLQIRVWYEFALIRDRKLVVITNKGINWTAIVYTYQVKRDIMTENILSKNVIEVIPKSGWKTFLNKLFALKILTLPDEYNVKGYGSGFDGKTYNVEIATKNQYRFYGYWEPQSYQNKFWQAKNMSDILNLLEAELGVRQRSTSTQQRVLRQRLTSKVKSSFQIKPTARLT